MKDESILRPHSFLSKILFLTILCLVFSHSIVSAVASPFLPNPDRITYKPLSFTPPKAERVTLDNGLVLYVLEDHELPLVKITAVIRTGTMFDPP